MANDVYRSVKNCLECVLRMLYQKCGRQLQLFTASSPLEFVVMDILGLLPKTSNCNKFVLVMTDRDSMLTRAEQKSKMTVAPIASMFMDHCIFP